MLKHYYIIAYRNLLKYKLYSLINMLGLSVGLACCILIALFVRHELSYEQWLSNADNLYRFESRLQGPNTRMHIHKANFVAASYLKQFYPEIKQAVRIIDHEMVLSVSDRKFFEKTWFVDKGFFEVFDLPLLKGSRETILDDKYSIILSEEMAQKYFSESDAVGKVINAGGQRDYKVVGILKNIPGNSHLSFDFIIPYDENDEFFSLGYTQEWLAFDGYTYLLFEEGFSEDDFNQRYPEFVKQFIRVPFFQGDPNMVEYFPPPLINIRDIHLKGRGIVSSKPGGDVVIVYAFSVIAVLILLLACVNFLNLTTTRSFQRAREVAIRKVVGANRKQLIIQYFGESVFFVLLALIFALALIEIILPWYISFVGKDISLGILDSIELIVLMGVLILLVGLFGGLYPAMVLSSYSPSSILKSGRTNTTGGSNRLRMLPVVFQFSVSIALIIATVIIAAQNQYVDHKDLGFNPENKLLLRNLDHEYTRTKRDVLGSKLRQLPGVINVAYSAAAPSDLMGFSREVNVPDYPSDSPVVLSPKSVGYEFFKVYGIPLIAGRNFSKDFARDEFYWPDGSSLIVGMLEDTLGTDASDERRMPYSSVILNEEALKEIGFGDAQGAIGKLIVMDDSEFQIIGVVPNFHAFSLRNKIEANMYILAPEDHITLTVHYQEGADTYQLVAQVKEIINELAPNFPLEYEFLEKNIKVQYEIDQKIERLMAIFSGIAILIACFGLYAMAAYSTQKRTKEISIRKVHGAKISTIFNMLIGQFSRPVFFANIIAWPLAYYSVKEYLNSFAYRIELSVWYFLLASLATVLIAWLTIMYHTNKAARARPADVLHYE